MGRTLVALPLASFVPLGVTYLARKQISLKNPTGAAINRFVVFCLFSLILISNLVDQCWVPFSLWPVRVRLRQRVIDYIRFICLAASVTGTATIALFLTFRQYIAAGSGARGPSLAAWQMIHGHFLGRLPRRLK